MVKYAIETLGFSPVRNRLPLDARVWNRGTRFEIRALRQYIELLCRLGYVLRMAGL